MVDMVVRDGLLVGHRDAAGGLQGTPTLLFVSKYTKKAERVFRNGVLWY